MTLAVDDATDGKCKIKLAGGGSQMERELEVQLNPAGMQRKAAEMQKQMDQVKAHTADVVGKRWDVKLPSGKSETWTTEPGTFGITVFQDSKGEKLSMMLGQDDTVAVTLGGCLLQGKIANGKVIDGQSILPGCPVGTGAWNASISK